MGPHRFGTRVLCIVGTAVAGFGEICVKALLNIFHFVLRIFCSHLLAKHPSDGDLLQPGKPTHSELSNRGDNSSFEV